MTSLSGSAATSRSGSTGLKMLGDGEWQAHKHKTSNQRRSWRKLHLGIDGDGYIIASALTDRIADDACVAVSMLAQIKGNIARFTADGAYVRDRCMRRWLHRVSPTSGS